jgi:hypothetical protein
MSASHLSRHWCNGFTETKEIKEMGMGKAFSWIGFLLGVGGAPMGWAQQTVVAVQSGAFVPAGTLLGCTLDEPNFSSQTARPGDPLLCKTTSLQMFGRQLIPRGAYLSARLQDYRDPGRFAGKGWIQLEFTGLILAGGSVPMNAKVISAASYRVNGEGKIQGRGHATRDAIEWSIPILWPIKVLTLPARGPRPVFRSETRIELRLMEDMVIPESLYAMYGEAPRRSSSLDPEKDDDNSVGSSGNVRSAKMSLPARLQAPSTPTQRYPNIPARNQAPSPDGQRRLTVLVLRVGSRYLVASYRAENGRLDYTTTGGARQALPLDALDVAATTRVNAERGVAFLLPATVR